MGNKISINKTDILSAKLTEIKYIIKISAKNDNGTGIDNRKL